MSTLVVRDLRAGYGHSTVLRGVDLSVDSGQIVAVVGPNGAGKTTLLRSLSGLVPHTEGSATLNGTELMCKRPYRIARLGFAHVPEGRGTIAPLSVHENLWLGGGGMARDEIAAQVDRMYDVFPALARLRQRAAGLLSGGEQQMLVIARGLVSNPSIVAIDEPSMGLAPIIVDSLMATLASAAGTGVGVLLVEQNTALAGRLAEHVHVLRDGELHSHDPSSGDLMSSFLE